jgi:hypothetical protein
MGRPSIFTQQVAAAICTRLASGESLRAICRDADMPDRQSVANWLTQDEQFFGQYTRARDLGLDDMADDVLEIADKDPGITDMGATDSGMVAALRLRFDARRWYLSKLAPKKYGDKQHIEHSGSIDTVAALVAARKRSGIR